MARKRKLTRKQLRYFAPRVKRRAKRVYSDMARRRGSRRGSKRGTLGSIGGFLKSLVIGAGAANIGALVSAKTGVSPLIPSVGIGYITGKTTGAISAIAYPLFASYLANMGGIGGGQQAQAPIGQVWR